MNFISLTPLDWIVTVGYLVAISAIGFLASRRVKGTDSYFLGARRFSKWLMIGQSFGVGTHAEMPVSLAGAVYTTGLSAIWYQWKNLFATPFYWLFAPLFRRMRRTTTGEVMEDRYGWWQGILYTVFALAFFTINMASMLKGAAKVISQAVGGNVPVNGLVIAMTIAFVSYSFVGGLIAAAYTDFVQGFLILVLSFLCIPFGWGVVGGFAGMKAVLEPYRFSLATPQGIGVFFIAMLTLNGLVGIMAQPHMISSVGTGKDEYACRTGFLYGNFVKRFCTVGWVVIGLLVTAMTVRGLYGVHSLSDPEEAFGFACRHLLFPGAVGLLIACVLAANMAACSVFMVNSGALFTRNIYKRYLVPTATDAHYLLIGRVSGVAVALLGVFYSVLFVARVLNSFLLTETLSTFVGIGLLGGIIWPRANRWGALASLVVSASVNFGLYALRHERLDRWDPSVFSAALLTGIAALVLVSLVTRPEPSAALQVFFGNLQSPSDSLDDSLPNQPTMQPRADVAAQGKQLIIVNLLRLRRGIAGQKFWVAYRQDLAGFAWGWVVTLSMVAAVYWLFRL